VDAAEVSPLALLACLVALYTGWQLFPDGPLAFYVSTGAFVVAVSVASRSWPVGLFGTVLGAMHAGCGLMYVGDGRSFVCDRATGLPITPLVLSAGAGIAVYYVGRKKNAA
jgi:hypothetical protein